MTGLDGTSWPATKDSHNESAALAPSNRSKRRATRACDRCKHKKMRCTGKQPCLNCINSGVQSECSYTAKYTRGKAPPIQPATYKNSHVSRTSWRTEITVSTREGSSDNSSRGASPTPGRLLYHFDNLLEEEKGSSFASIPRRTQQRHSYITTSKHHNPIFASGDAPLPKPDLTFFVLPPLEEARSLVRKFFDVATPNSQIVHQPTIELWLLDVFRSFGTGQDIDNARAAVILLMFAISYNFQDSASEEEDTVVSFRYFQAADEILQSEKGEIRLESVQARLLQCFYLLSRSRINHTWSVFGSVINQVLALNLHRSAEWDRPSEKDLILLECRKRVFWSTYTLDKYLGLCFGRPHYLRDDMIDQVRSSGALPFLCGGPQRVQEMPLLVNDENLSKTSCIVTSNELQCTIRAPQYQIQQAIILGAMLIELYGIRSQTLEQRLQSARKHHNSIKLLAHNNKSFLEQDTSNMKTLLRRQLFNTKLSYSLLLVVLFRPFLLDIAEDDDEYISVHQDEHENNITFCLEAAMELTRAVDLIFNISQVFNGSWFTHYCGYTAAVSLYVFVIKHQNEPETSWQEYFNAAEKCQSQIKVAAEKESFSQKCGKVLEKLHAEAMVHIAGRKRQEERRDSFREQRSNESARSQMPQYSERFDMNPSGEGSRQPIPEFTYEEDWQKMNFDQTAPGGGILGSMDWIQMQSPNSMIDQIERWGFASLTLW